MDTRYRKLFNEAYTPAIYDRYIKELSTRLGVGFSFRNAETPVFVPLDVRDACATAAKEIVDQLMDPARQKKFEGAIPERWKAPGLDGSSSFTQIDFAIVRKPDGTLVPRLIELQGFPSLTALQAVTAQVWNGLLADIPGLDKPWSCWYDGIDMDRFVQLARRTIVGDHAPEEVILMDLDPPSQKTFPDFVATKQLFDVDAVCPRDLIKKGKDLFRKAADGSGRLVPVRRIYNRVVFDELEKKGWTLPFDYRDELNVEWSSHPNWFWMWSKYSMPFLDHPAVPRAVLLSELESLPADLETGYVLKPLFSFAGGGVNVEPTAADVAKVPEADRPFWCLQEKIEYAPALVTPTGDGVKIETRLMFLRPPESQKPILVQNMCRLSRGKLHGVDFNKNFTWVGSTVGLWPQGAHP